MHGIREISRTPLRLHVPGIAHFSSTVHVHCCREGGSDPYVAVIRDILDISLGKRTPFFCRYKTIVSDVMILRSMYLDPTMCYIYVDVIDVIPFRWLFISRLLHSTPHG